MTFESWYLEILAVAAVSAFLLSMLVERAGVRLGLVDRPRQGEIQQHAVPRTGGYGIVLAFWLAIGASFLVTPEDLERLPADNVRLFGVFLGTLALLPLAAVDDARRLGPAPQLLGQIGAAVVPVLFGLRMEEVATPFGVVQVPDPIGAALAVVWVVAMINAINLLDTMDGLAAGVAAIASVVLFIRTIWFGQASIAVLPLAAAGACLGFLPRNWHPSRLIMGSSGALILGYLLGVITLVGGAKIGTAFLVLAVPILDVAWVIYRRLSQGRSPFRGGDTEHLPHRLRALGVSDRRIALSVYSVSAAIGLAVLSMHTALPTVEKAYLAVAVVIGVLTALALLTRASRASGQRM